MSESDTPRRRKVKRDIACHENGNFKPVEGWVEEFSHPIYGKMEFLIRPYDEAGMFTITETLTGKHLGMTLQGREACFDYLTRLFAATDEKSERLKLSLASLRAAHVLLGFVTTAYAGVKQTMFKAEAKVVSSKLPHVFGVLKVTKDNVWTVTSADARRHLGTNYETFPILPDPDLGLGIWLKHDN